jgi:hypothetical protein
MDRLLSDIEITEIDNRHYSPSSYGGVVLNMINSRKDCIEAQLSKTDKEWIKWIENNLMECSYHKEPFMCIPVINWEVRKKEIEI